MCPTIKRKVGCGAQRGLTSDRPTIDCRQLLFDPATEGLYRRTVSSRSRENKIQGAARGQRKRDWDHQAAGPQVIIGKEVVRQQDTCILARRLERMIGAVEPQPMADIEVTYSRCHEPIGPGRDTHSIGEGIVVNEGRAQKCLRR